MRHRVVTLVSPYQEMYPVTCASAVFGYHGPDIPQLYDFQLCAERPGTISTTMGADIVIVHGLEETDLPVETIAQRVGLSSAVNLRRRFHNALNTTPAAYRRSFR